MSAVVVLITSHINDISYRIFKDHIQLYVTCTVYHLLIGDAIGFLLIWDGCVTAYHRSHKQNSLNHEI